MRKKNVNRSQAYKLLITEIQYISQKSVEELCELSATSISTEKVTESGARYSISIKVTPKNEETYIIEGNIHDNNSFKYELLEEKIVINK
ncbi:hypothetical protein [Sulfurovum sp.]|uniref:hypothetical protein n=1 Tax=Sulfurovum sp. TaxID=1969726 RepID=UPI0035639F6A